MWPLWPSFTTSTTTSTITTNTTTTITTTITTTTILLRLLLLLIIMIVVFIKNNKIKLDISCYITSYITISFKNTKTPYLFNSRRILIG